MPYETFHTESEEKRARWGASWAELARGGAAIGQLGAGKTTLAKGIVEGSGAASQIEVSSPTFTLMHQYGTGEPPISASISTCRTRHVRWRPRWTKCSAKSGTLVLLEWAERFPALLPERRSEIRLSAIDHDSREIAISHLG